MKWRKATRSMVWAAVISASLGTVAHAKQCELVPKDVATLEETERVQLLQQFKFAELDDRLSKHAKKTLAQPGGDLLLLRDISYLQQVAGGNDGKLLRMWLDERPQSYLARYTLGLYYGQKAFSVRGGDLGNTVTNAQMREVKKYGDQAVEHFQKAIAMDPRNSLPYASLIGLAAMQGSAGGQDAMQWYQAADKAVPKNLAARIQAVTFLGPRYGVPYSFAEQMVTQSEKSLPSDVVNYLKYNLVIDKAGYYEMFERDKPKALATYKQALSMCENSETARAGILRNY